MRGFNFAISQVFASFNFAKRARIPENAKLNLAKINPIKVFFNLEKCVNIDTQVCHNTSIHYKKYFTSSGIFLLIFSRIIFSQPLVMSIMRCTVIMSYSSILFLFRDNQFTKDNI